MRRTVAGVLLALLVLLTGCASGRGPQPDGARMEKNGPVVFIHPLTDSYRQATVGVLPFQVPAGIPAEQGLRVSALFKDVLLGKRAFPVIRQLTTPYGNLEEALALGREAGVELVMAGRVEQLLAGTEFGGARASVAVRLLDTASGHSVWYVAQSMTQEMDYPDLSFGSRLRASLSMPPVRQAAGPQATVNMLSQIATDLADVLQGARTVRR
jgi:hypothetical protein